MMASVTVWSVANRECVAYTFMLRKVRSTLYLYCIQLHNSILFWLL